MSFEESNTLGNDKRIAILTESSLSCLAKEISSNNIRFFMNLGIPTCNIVIIKSENSDNGLPFEKISESLLLFWLEMKKHANDKDKVLNLEQALRASNEMRLADIVIERYRLNMDLAPGVFKDS